MITIFLGKPTYKMWEKPHTRFPLCLFVAPSLEKNSPFTTHLKGKNLFGVIVMVLMHNDCQTENFEWFGDFFFSFIWFGFCGVGFFGVFVCGGFFIVVLVFWG